MAASDEAIDISTSPTASVPNSSPHVPPATGPISSSSEETTAENMQDTGPLQEEWCQNLLDRYSTDLSKLDDEEEAILYRLSAIQKLQLIWATAGREGEIEYSDKRIKTRTTKVVLEDEQLSKKRRKLSGAMSAVKDLVGMLDGAESLQSTQVDA